MRIRRYTRADLGSVMGIFRSNIPRYFVAEEEAGLLLFLSRHSEYYFVLETADEIVGCGGFALNAGEKPTVSLCWGMVHADHLGAGLGRKLTEYRLGLIREQYANIPVVISTSQHTEGFYERFGFVTTRREPDGFGPTIDVCEMRLEASAL